MDGAERVSGRGCVTEISGSRPVRLDRGSTFAVPVDLLVATHQGWICAHGAP